MTIGITILFAASLLPPVSAEQTVQPQHIDRERITVEEISQWRRTLRQRVKEMPEWDRNTFEEVGP